MLKNAPWMEWWTAGPPWWFRSGEWLLTNLTALCLALVVLLQWFLWLITTGNLISPWGVILGIAVAAAQMLVLFGPKKHPRGSCPLPRDE